MASRTDTALDQLNHIIDATFSSVENFELFDRYITLQSLYTALDHQLQDGLMDQHEFYRTRYIVRKLWDLKLHIHMIEKEGTQLYDVIGHVITLILHLCVLRGYNCKIVVCLRVYVFAYEMMSRLIAKGIIRSYSMRRQRRIAVVKPMGSYPFVMFLMDSCLMHVVTCTRTMLILLLHQGYSIFDRILHELQYLHREKPHHFTLDLDQLDRILEYRFIQNSSYYFLVTNVELEYMFDTLGFLWLHRDRPSYLLYLLEKLVDGLSEGRGFKSRCELKFLKALVWRLHVRFPCIYVQTGLYPT